MVVEGQGMVEESEEGGVVVWVVVEEPWELWVGCVAGESR